VLGGVAALAIWFFLLTDGRGLVTRMGPYQGKVIDAETGQPVPNAYVIFTWDAASPFGAANCATAAIARSDSEGSYRLGWQGYRNLFDIGVVSWSPPTVDVIGEDYRPWSVGKDGPGYPDDLYFIPPRVSPLLLNTVGTIQLTSLHGRAYGDDDFRHLSSCAEVANISSRLVGYLSFRSWWNANCSERHSRRPIVNDLIYFGTGFPSDTVVLAADRQHPLRSDIKTLGELRQHLQELIGFDKELKEKQRPDLVPALDQKTTEAVCALTNIRMPIFEETGR
jgi:hypothetical protein